MGTVKESSITFIKALIAGIAIGIGAIVFLSCENKIIGSLLFGIGLFIILHGSFYLFTGKVGYMATNFNKPKEWRDLIITWFGNFAGTFLVGSLINLTRVSQPLALKAEVLCAAKLGDSFLSLFILAIFCGILMYIAVNGYKNIIEPCFLKELTIFLPVMVFILCGFEHCIANMAYFTIAGMLSWQALGALGIMTLGNAVGGLLIPCFFIIMSKIKSKI